MAYSGSRAEAMRTQTPMRWWGWGSEDHPQLLGAKALSSLRERLGVQAPPQPPVALSEVRLPDSRLPASMTQEFQRVVGHGGVWLDRRSRIQRAAGRGYLDLVRLRRGDLQQAPDAVLLPGDRNQLLALLQLCSQRGVAVVPFGGGTSVVGGVCPLRGCHEAVIALDLGTISEVSELDRVSQTVTVGAGMRVAALERLLAGEGLTLGHFPQSYEHVSLGGCAATRSAGQASTGYGRFEQLVLGARLSTPSGAIETQALPATAAGPDLRQLIVGSEGALGVIEELTLRLAPAPVSRHYEGMLFSDFEMGAQALRQLIQDGPRPTVARLSDREETALTLSLASGGLEQRAASLYIGARRMRHGCLAIVGFEGDEDEVAFARGRLRALTRAHGAVRLGRAAGEAWLASRFEGPYMRDELMTHGIIVETLETATVWSKLGALKAAIETAISQALAGCGTPPLVGCHISHLYRSGASLYFTFLARSLPGQEEQQWSAAKQAASEAILQAGGTITHHHAIGSDHARWLAGEIGEGGMRALAALKRELDPQGIMNPGKLLASG